MTKEQNGLPLWGYVLVAVFGAVFVGYSVLVLAGVLYGEIGSLQLSSVIAKYHWTFAIALVASLFLRQARICAVVLAVIFVHETLSLVTVLAFSTYEDLGQTFGRAFVSAASAVVLAFGAYHLWKFTPGLTVPSATHLDETFFDRGRKD